MTCCFYRKWQVYISTPTSRRFLGSYSESNTFPLFSANQEVKGKKVCRWEPKAERTAFFIMVDRWAAMHQGEHRAHCMLQYIHFMPGGDVCADSSCSHLMNSFVHCYVSTNGSWCACVQMKKLGACQAEQEEVVMQRAEKCSRLTTLLGSWVSFLLRQSPVSSCILWERMRQDEKQQMVVVVRLGVFITLGYSCYNSFL